MSSDAIEQIEATLEWIGNDDLRLIVADLEEFERGCTMLRACRGLLEKRQEQQQSNEEGR